MYLFKVSPLLIPSPRPNGRNDDKERGMREVQERLCDSVNREVELPGMIRNPICVIFI